MADSKRPVLILNSAGAEVGSIDAYAGPASIVVKRIGWKRLAAAEKAGTAEAFSMIKHMGGPRVAKEFQEAAKDALAEANAEGKTSDVDAKAALAAKAAKDPLAGYDMAELLYAGIETMDGAQSGKDLGPAIDDLEPEVADAAARAILRLSRPSLFETEEERKNG